MISSEEAIKIQALLIEKFGGTSGLRNKESLHSALIRPFQMFGGKELYPTPEDKAGALLESIIANHPFIDGNKRLGFVLMKLLLLEANRILLASHDDCYQFIIEVANGKLGIGEITDWIKNHVEVRLP